MITNLILFPDPRIFFQNLNGIIFNFHAVFFQQLLGLLPYLGIVLLFKLFVPTLLLRFLVIGVFSLAWFVVLQLFILPDTIFRAQWNRLADHLHKEE